MIIKRSNDDNYSNNKIIMKTVTIMIEIVVMIPIITITLITVI